MAKELQVLSWDDIALARGERLEATGEVAVGYNGTEVVLDVSQATREYLENFLLPVLKAGRKVKADERASTPPRYNYRPGSKQRKQDLRDWAKAQVKADPSLTERYNYITPGGGFYYPIGLKKDYKAATGIDVDAPIR